MPRLIENDNQTWPQNGLRDANVLERAWRWTESIAQKASYRSLTSRSASASSEPFQNVGYFSEGPWPVSQVCGPMFTRLCRLFTEQLRGG
jgi:hypothetical protein